MRTSLIVRVTAVVGLVAATIGFLPGAGEDRTAGADTGCTLATLRGAYALYGTGSAPGVPVALIGTVTFDGAGRATANFIESYGGVIDDGTIESTYTLQPDCRGSAVANMKHHVRRAGAAGAAHEYRHEIHSVDLIVAAGGQKFLWLLTDTYPQATPPGVPALDDPITANGWGERM